jgi:hypothetical protein
MKGLTWNGWEQDRQLLAALERPAWEQVAAELKSEIRDEVIARAARCMPAEYFEIDGSRLITDLTGRRDRLIEAADAFYEHPADKVQVHLTDASVRRDPRLGGGGSWCRSGPGVRTAVPRVSRSFAGPSTRARRGKSRSSCVAAPIGS